MRRALTLHPDFRCDPVSVIAVEIARPAPGRLTLRYALTGDVAGLWLPAPAAPERTDELWRHTCFEVFLRSPEGEAYYEFNFALSTQWAAYRFDSYRQGMAPAEGIAAPHIALAATHDGFDLDVALDLPREGPWRLGASAVIETVEDRVSYWALAHPAGRPDFHHPDCFALELAATDRP
jgi:hypothetical protein